MLTLGTLLVMDCKILYSWCDVIIVILSACKPFQEMQCKYSSTKAITIVNIHFLPWTPVLCTWVPSIVMTLFTVRHRYVPIRMFIGASHTDNIRPWTDLALTSLTVTSVRAKLSNLVQSSLNWTWTNNFCCLTDLTKTLPIMSIIIQQCR